MLDENTDESTCAAEEGKDASSETCKQAATPVPDHLLRWGEQDVSVRHLMDVMDNGCPLQLCEWALQPLAQQISAVSEEEQWKGKKIWSVSCVSGGKNCSFWGVITVIKSCTTSAQSLQRSVLIVFFPMTCKEEQYLLNSDRSAKKHHHKQPTALASWTFWN